MPKPVTTMEFMRSASWIAKHAADWVGCEGCNVIGGLEDANSIMRPDALERFRAAILTHLDTATGHTE